MKTLSALLLLAGSGVLSTLVLPVLAQSGGYSLAGANAYVAAKDWKGLLAYTERWSSVSPNDPMPWYYMGQTYGYGFNQPTEAIQAFRHALSLKEQWPEAWHALGFNYIQARQYSDAITAYRRAIALAPDRPNYWNMLCVAYAAQGDWNDAMGTLREQQQHMAKATSYDWYDLGNSYSNLGRYQEAMPAYTQSLHMNPSYAEAWNNLGVAKQMTGNKAEAEAAYKRAAQLGDASSPGNFAKLQQSIAASRAAATQSSGSAPHCVPWVSTPSNSNCGYSGHDPCPHPLTICR